MLLITTVDGATFSGESPADVVRAMRNDEWNRDQPKGEYMDDVVHRVEQITGKMMSVPVTPDAFLTYLNDMEMLAITALPNPG